MTLKKKGRRNITVDNIRYVWLANPDGDGNMHISVSLAEGGQILNAWIYIIFDNGVLIVTNYIVRQIIKQGLAEGWMPTAEKGIVYLKRFQEMDVSKATFAYERPKKD